MWGYVRGGMGMVSFYLLRRRPRSRSDRRRRRAGRRIIPGEGVLLKAASASPRRTVISNADPRQTLSCSARGRPRVARAGRAGSHRRLHRQAQRPSYASCPTSPPVPATNSPITTARSTRRSPRTNGRPAIAAARRGEIAARISGASSTSRASTTLPSSRRASTP